MENNDFTTIMSIEEEEELSKSIVQGISDTDNLLYCSFNPETAEDKVKAYNAMNGESQRLKSFLNKEVIMVDAVIIAVKLEGKNGATNVVPRITIIDNKGNNLVATSWGVYRSLQKIAGLFGGLHFEKGISITPIEVPTKEGQTVNLKVNKVIK